MPPIPLPIESTRCTTDVRLPESVGLSLIEAVEAVRTTNAALGHVRIQVKGKEVYVSGCVARFDEIASFAEIVSRLPGVERVILEYIQVSPACEIQ